MARRAIFVGFHVRSIASRKALICRDFAIVFRDLRIGPMPESASTTPRQAGPPLEVYRQPQSRFVAEFLGETNLLEGRADGAVIATDAGAFITTVPTTTTGSVLLSIRPEAWRIAFRQEPVNSFPGRITQTVYLGELARHRFSLETGHDLTIFELNPRPHDSTGPLYATVDPADVVPIVGP